MTWNTFSRDPFQVQDRQIWPVFVDSLAQRQIKNQNTDTVWKTSKARLKHPPCIKTFLYKNNHKVANSYFPTWWDRLQPGINLDMCGADCGPAFRESIKLEVESCREKNRMLWSRQLNWAVGGTRSRTLTCPSAAHRSCPTQASGTKQDTHCGNSYLFFTWVSPWYSQYLTHNSSLLIPHTVSAGAAAHTAVWESGWQPSVPDSRNTSCFCCLGWETGRVCQQKVGQETGGILRCGAGADAR